MLYFNTKIILLCRNEIHNRSNGGDDNDNDDNNKDGCEMEYLRNILYEYMMGKQPMVRDIITIFNFVIPK